MAATSTRRRVLVFAAGTLALMGLALAAPPAAAQNAAGKVTALEGEAWVQKSFFRREMLRSGSVIHAGDDLRTGEERDTLIQMRFLDQTVFTLGPDARMSVDAYDERDDAPSSFAASIVKGAFRFVSGLLAKRDPRRVNVNVSVATIGVRGTHVAGEVFEAEETENGLIEASARIMLLEDPEGEDSAIEVSNQFGSVIIDEPGFGTEIPDERSPPSPARRMQLRTVENLMRVIRNTTRGATPRRLR